MGFSIGLLVDCVFFSASLSLSLSLTPSPLSFLKVSTNVDKWLWMLGAQRVLTRGEGDCNAVQSKHGSIEADFTAWKTKFISRLQALQRGEKKACGGNCKRGKCESAQHGRG